MVPGRATFDPTVTVTLQLYSTPERLRYDCFQDLIREIGQARPAVDIAARTLYNGNMMLCLFATDLHGRVDRYEKLFAAIELEMPRAVFLGGDLLPHALVAAGQEDFLNDVVASGLERLAGRLKNRYPTVYVILGNDDGRYEEATVKSIAARNLWLYAHGRRFEIGGYAVYGYSFVPPTPFMQKDWERYDVSRYAPPGAISPEEGRRSVDAKSHEIRSDTIQKDLQKLTGERDLSKAVVLFHTPPHDTTLDRAALDGKMIDHVPLDLHVGSIAVRRFIETRQPLLTLHGHVHESTRLTGAWMDQIGRTVMFNAAHDGPELSLVKFQLEDPEKGKRVLL
jgi:Icc-related predicted phosphoesterase